MALSENIYSEIFKPIDKGFAFRQIESEHYLFFKKVLCNKK